jgi:hypothetical protein
LLGELFVSASVLPKKAIINFIEKENSKTQIAVQVTDTHKFGLKAGFVNKYQGALEELANSILSGIE